MRTLSVAFAFEAALASLGVACRGRTSFLGQELRFLITVLLDKVNYLVVDEAFVIWLVHSSANESVAATT